MIMNPSAIKHVVLDGHSLTLESFVAVVRYNATVELAGSALEAMKKSRALAEKIADEGRVAYGITTGFGDFQKVAVPEEMSNQLSTNLILSHCTGAGDPYTEEVVRGMLVLRANALCGGVSGVRPILVEMMIQMLNAGVHPWVPQKGSLGSSGDLAPLAHMTLPLLGKGQAYYKGELMAGGEAMAKAGIPTLDTLVCKEGLGMTNGTCAMTSVGSLALYDTICAAQLGDVIGSMDFEALTGLRNAFDPRIHQVRGQKGQMLVAENMRKLLEEIVRRYYDALCERRQGKGTDSAVYKLELLMQQAGITTEIRPVAARANGLAEATGEPAMVIQLAGGALVSGKTSELMGCSAAALLNALKALSGAGGHGVHLIAQSAIEPIQTVKVKYLGSANPRLHSDEVLIALASSANQEPKAAKALEQLAALKGCQAHCSVILSPADANTYKKLGIQLTCEPKYQTNQLYHR